MQIVWRHPEVFWYAVPALVAIIVLFTVAHRRRQAFSRSFSEAEPRIGYTLCGLFFLALGIMCALADPREAHGKVNKQLLHAVIVYDVSSSMAGEDVMPSRLQAGAYAIRRMSERYGEGKVTLVIFGEEPLQVGGITTDTSELVWMLEHSVPGMIPKPGSNVASAVMFGTVLIREKMKGKGIIVLVSDGGDLTHQDVMIIGSTLKSQHISVIALGIGTEMGALVELEKGHKELARFNEQEMKFLAESSGGEYRRLVSGAEIAEMLSHKQQFLVMTSVPGERAWYRVPLGLALIGLCILYVAESRS